MVDPKHAVVLAGIETDGDGIAEVIGEIDPDNVVET